MPEPEPRYLDKVEITPIIDDEEFDVDIIGKSRPLEIVIPRTLDIPKFRLIGYEKIDYNFVRKIEVEILLAGPINITTERLSLQSSQDN